MKGLKLTLLGLGILLMGCAYAISTNYYLFFPKGAFVATMIGLVVMILGYRKDDDGPDKPQKDEQP